MEGLEANPSYYGLAPSLTTQLGYFPPITVIKEELKITSFVVNNFKVIVSKKG